jgi:hypothetical protein
MANHYEHHFLEVCGVTEVKLQVIENINRLRFTGKGFNKPEKKRYVKSRTVYLFKRLCKWCGKPISKFRRIASVTCSMKCAYELHLAKTRTYFNPEPMRETCVVCGVHFVPDNNYHGRGGSFVCSSECRRKRINQINLLSLRRHNPAKHYQCHNCQAMLKGENKVGDNVIYCPKCGALTNFYTGESYGHKVLLRMRPSFLRSHYVTSAAHGHLLNEYEDEYDLWTYELYNGDDDELQSG